MAGWIYEINGELYKTKKDIANGLIKLPRKLKGKLKPHMRYKEILEDIYVPLKYFSKEDIEKLTRCIDELRAEGISYHRIWNKVVERLIDMLKRKGFVIEDEPDDEAGYLSVEAPDGKDGWVEVYDSRYDEPGEIRFSGELGLLAMTLGIYYYTRLHPWYY